MKLKGFFFVQLILIFILSLPILCNTYMPFLRVNGNSMSPYLSEGSIIVIRNTGVPQGKDLLGQVIVFYDPLLGKIVVHRVIKIEGEKFLITKGDNNAFADSFRPIPEDIFGVVALKVWPFMGKGAS